MEVPDDFRQEDAETLLKNLTRYTNFEDDTKGGYSDDEVEVEKIKVDDDIDLSDEDHAQVKIERQGLGWTVKPMESPSLFAPF